MRCAGRPGRPTSALPGFHDQATLDALVAAAHEQGMLVIAHASSAASVAKAQAAGADILTHAPLEQALDPAAAAQAAGRRKWALAGGARDRSENSILFLQARAHGHAGPFAGYFT
jgi:imidazolonepropionase-like amidohydrolase